MDTNLEFVELITERKQHSIVNCKMAHCPGTHRVFERITSKRLHIHDWHTLGFQQIFHTAPKLFLDLVRLFLFRCIRGERNGKIHM